MNQHDTEPHVLQFRKCGMTDLDAIMNLQALVCRGIKNKDIFVPSERDQNEANLKPPNFILGCFDRTLMAAYCSVVFPGENMNNLGWDLLWPREKVLSCALLDTIVVHPSFRGQHLQRRLIQYAIALLEESPDIRYLLTTVSPHNPYSLSNVQALDFVILMKKLKYGGKERFILCRTL